MAIAFYNFQLQVLLQCIESQNLNFNNIKNNKTNAYVTTLQRDDSAYFS